ncbi:MAG: peptidase M16-like protein [Acidobacteriaceae bacterium]|nr:peptidase M16-like protein [Acidobacteriaceae bacterium]
MIALKRFSVFVLLLASSSFIFAQATKPAPKTTAVKPEATAKPATAAKSPAGSQLPTLKFDKFKLANGLEVIVSEDHRLPMVAVNLWYHVGPANERPGRTGFAHLFEHMMFSGSRHVQGPKGESAHFKVLSGAGATNINGSTDFDRTNYFETVPSNQVELALWIESDRMGFLLDTLDGQKLITQRDVVRNERRQSTENPPYGLADEEMDHQLYPKGHPYYGSVIGSHADIEAARLGDVRDFFKQYYVPNNCTIAIVGDITKVKAKELVEKYFGSIPAGAPVPPIDAVTPAITDEKRIIVTDQIELPRVAMAWLTPSIYKPGDPEADILGQVLGGGKASRLYQSLVYDKKIAQTVSASQRSLILGSNFTIEATAKPGVKPEDLEKAIQEELDKIRKEGPTQAEVDRARAAIESRLIAGLESFNGVANRLNAYNHYVGNPGYLSTELKNFENVTAAGVQKFAESKLTDDSRVVIYAIKGKKVITDVPRTNDPKEATLTAGETTASEKDNWRSNAPTPGPTPALTLPTPVVSHLANGLTLMLVERHNLPIVSATLVVNSGSEQNPADRAGLAAFTAALLQEGTEKRSSLQIAEETDAIGASINAGSSSDSSGVTMRTLKRSVDAAFDIMSDVALHPTFDPKEFDRVRDRRVTQVMQQRENAVALSSLVFNRMLYGDSHPYGTVELGTGASLKATTRDDLVKFWKAGYVPGNSALVVAGDMTSAELKSIAEKYFSNWSGKAPGFTLAATAEPAERKIIIVDKPGAPQTSVYVGQIGIKRSSPDYATAVVMNTALGGIFSSRINMNLREVHGYTYGARSGFTFRHAAGPFFVTSQVRTDVTAPSVREMFNELEGMKDRPLTSDEVKLSKDYIVGSVAALFETSAGVVNNLSNIFVYHLPNNYYQLYPGQIKAVTPATVQTFATKLLKPESMVVVAVGDRAKIEPELKKLNLGGIELRDADAKPITAPAAAGSGSSQN